MVKKLLHERLMEKPRPGSPNYHTSAYDIGGFTFCLDKARAEAIADDIERDYTPKAVDANGKPWEINDPCTCAGKKATVVGYGDKNNVFVYSDFDSDYFLVAGTFIERYTERTPIEKLRDEIASYAHSYVPDSVLDGWVKDLDAYIDQQGKDE